MPGPAFGVPVIEYGLGYPKQGPAGTLSAEAAGTRVRANAFGQAVLAPSDTLQAYVANVSAAGKTYRAAILAIAASPTSR